MSITLLDGILVVIMLISAILVMIRGFSREVLSIVSWIAAAVAAAGATQQAVDMTPEPEPQTANTRTASTQAAESEVIAPVSSLTRTRYVAPKYPRMAQRRNQSGWVDVVFTVSRDGSVKDVEVRNSEPGTIFVDAAKNAVEKWKFEPVIENGRVVEKRAGVRMMFALE